VDERRRLRIVGLLIRLAVVGGAYYGSARLGLELSLVRGSVTPLWPPTAVAVIGLLAGGYGVAPAIAAAAFAVNEPMSSTAAAVAIAAGNTVAPMLTVYLLRRVGFRRQLDRLRDALALSAFALIGMGVSASIGTTALYLSDEISSGRYLTTWLVWWTGDAMGVLIIAPFAWSLWSLRPRRWRAPNWQRLGEGAVLLAAVGVMSYFIARSETPLLFLILPMLVWIAWRLQQAGAGSAAVVCSVIVTIAAVNREGLFGEETLLHRMGVLQAFNTAVCLASFVFAAAVTQRREEGDALFLREHRIAETLQRSLLPDTVPHVPGVGLHARYIAASSESDIGGDWYDIVALDRNRVALVVGDVIGHGISAATAMAQLRMALRAIASECENAHDVLQRLNRLVLNLYPGVIATVLYGEFDVVKRAFCYANAGHPPPLLITDHEAFFLEGGVRPPVGVSGDVDYVDTRVELEEDDTVVLYTDGLIEQRHEPLDARLEMLRRVALEGPSGLEERCDHITSVLLDQGVTDDVAVLSFRAMSMAGESLTLKRPTMPATVADVRGILRRWLTDNGASDREAVEILAACGEAHTNVVRHAYSTTSGTVEIDASIVDGSEVALVVRDYGQWRIRNPADQAVGGRGLGLMNALMDSVDIHSNSHGTEVRMSRRLSVHG